MRRIIGPILGLLGIFVVLGLVAGAAYSAGLGAAGVMVAPGGATAVAPVVGYGWYGMPWFGFGFGHVLGFLLVLFLFFGLARLAFGGRRGYGPGWGPGWGPSHGRGPRGWGSGSAEGEGDRPNTGDPREAWIRSRLEEWHRDAHAADADPPARSASGPTDPPAAV
ncbi:MAG: hypothetical protein M3P84_00250 [Chloroflexota bacterium]|nr:hypothetical protein [Chloroflexota bacterium]